MEIDSKKQTLEQLKALAYDLIAQREVANMNLQKVNKEILSMTQDEELQRTSKTSKD